MANIAWLAILILGTDAGEEDQLGWAGEGNGDGFGEPAFRPFGIVVILFLERWCGLGESGGDDSNGCDGKRKADASYFQHECAP